MTILVTGGSGLIGRRLITCLEQWGHRVFRLVRSRDLAGDGAVYWSTSEGGFDWDEPGSIDAVAHLAGESILGRWTGAKKARIRDSRVDPTRNLCAFLAGMASPPSVLVCASATGYYGNRADERLGEASPPGEGFLPEVSQQWEAATEPARDAGIRVVNLRIGMVLTPDGGALAAMRTPFRLALGGKVGDGRQYMSWVTRDDLVSIIRYALESDVLAGPVNAVSPQPVTNAEFTRTLGQVLRRPTPFAIPAFAVRLLFGQMGSDLLLASARVEPERLREAGFQFEHADLEAALNDLLKEKPSNPAQ
ncbi:MAG: TIGR01777 family oxidoreductase [Gemmatimonadetes bacterium]|nr:TIGR01777 family oxidoreductase [Gemmatimonadota bacterium]